MAGRYDAVVVGGGHNGLVTAAYLAKMGWRVVVLESRHKTGGAADTSSPFPDLPGVKVTTLSYVMSLMPPSLIRDLKLEQLGYKVTAMSGAYAPQPGGGGLRYHDDFAGITESFSKFSKHDAAAWPEWRAWIARSADFTLEKLKEALKRSSEIH